MGNYIARYCLVTEDGGFQAAELEADNFLAAASLAIDRTPQLMKLYSIEQHPLPSPIHRRKWRDMKFRDGRSVSQ